MAVARLRRRSFRTSPGVLRHQLGALHEGDFVGVWEVATAAGGGAEVDRERIIGRVKFRRAWLTSHDLAARDCRIIQVLGESMEPTLVDGCSILVNHASRRRREGSIYVVRTDDGLMVKRAGKEADGNWLLVSDHPTSGRGRRCPGPTTRPCSARSAGPRGRYCEGESR